MTIQRQYSLPNCTLILEGLNDSTANSGQLDVRPVMSILVNAECHFAGAIPAISGGREFFDSLVMAVNRYAQQFLSGIFYTKELGNEPPLVQLQQISQNLHRLIVQRRGDVQVGLNNGATGNTGSSAPMAIELTTVQLFDLVEAVDQFFADTQTLPALSLQLTPVEKRFVQSDQPVIKEAAPVALGVSSLALAAAALFFIPVPEVEKPKEPNAQATPNSLSNTSGASGQPTSTEPPPSALPLTAEGVSASPLATETPTASPLATETPFASPLATETPFASPLATETPSASPLATETPSASPLAAETPLPGTTETTSPSQLTTNTTTTSEITDAVTLRDLNQRLHQQIRENKEQGLSFPRPLIYRVAVRPDGTIVDYEARNQSAFDYVEQTPLPKLKSTGTPTSSATGSEEPLAYFKVVFTSKGIPQVSPWRGFR